MMEAEGSFETLVIIYQTTWRHISEDDSLHLLFCLQFTYILFYFI
jgi:hypothetical protein